MERRGRSRRRAQGNAVRRGFWGIGFGEAGTVALLFRLADRQEDYIIRFIDRAITTLYVKCETAECAASSKGFAR